MKYECRQCGTGFEKSMGQASCPKCGSRSLWTTGGEARAALLVTAYFGLFLLLANRISPLIFFGGAIAAAFFLPYGIWFAFSRRKPKS